MAQVNPIQVKCPVCDAVLPIAAQHRGGTVACQRCGSTVKVPGQSSPQNDDDDWLRLESDLAPSPGRRSGALEEPDSGFPGPGFPDRGVSEPVFPAPSGQDDADPFDFPDLDDVPASPLARTTASPPPLSDADLAALGGFVDDGDEPVPMKPVPPKKPVDDTFGVRCKVCETLNYARPAQVGKRIRCHDCHSAITVPPPPKPKPKYQPDIEAAQVYTFADGDVDADRPRPPDPMRKTADEYLRAAEAADESEEEEWELPDLKHWLLGIVSIFRDGAVAMHAVMFTLIAFVPAAIAIQYESSIVVMGLFAGGAIFAALLVSCGFAILQSVANGEERVSEWPIFDPMEWIGQMILTIAAIGVAAGPAWLLGMYVFQGGLVTVAMSMISLYVLFPMVILSMLDEQSILTPFSADVSKSVMRAADQWGAAYLCSGILFFVIFMLFMISSVIPPVMGALLAIVTTVCGVFIYFGIVGRLAYGIGHAINAPPLANDIEQVRDSERRGKSLE